MATWKLRRFSSFDILQQIQSQRLRTFLEPYRNYLVARGVDLDAEKIDHWKLGNVFLTPTRKTPNELIDALYFVDELATDAGREQLLTEAELRGVILDEGADLSPADCAIQLWLQDRDLVERKHAENCLARVRSYEYYHMDRKPPPFQKPTLPQLQALSEELDEWFVNRKQGQGVRILVGKQDLVHWFVIRHPEPLKREENLADGQASSICYRPSKYDIVTYTPQLGELGIHATRKGEKQLYREKFGLHLFGDETIFPSSAKYALTPLQCDGENALVCSDVSGIEWVKLREIQLFRTGEPWELQTRKSADLFQLFAKRGEEFPGDRLVRAHFQIKFTEAKTPRVVILKPSNIAQYTRDDDRHLVEDWLQRRGFILTPQHLDDEPESILAGVG